MKDDFDTRSQQMLADLHMCEKELETARTVNLEHEKKSTGIVPLTRRSYTINLLLLMVAEDNALMVVRRCRATR